MTVMRRTVPKTAAATSALALGATFMPINSAHAHNKPPKEKWVATWSASTTVFGVGSPVAQPDLTPGGRRFASSSSTRTRICASKRFSNQFERIDRYKRQRLKVAYAG
jgi:hypothetical protein